MRRRFFVEAFEAGRAVLRGDSAEHLARVLRVQPGHLCELSDGGRLWLGRVERVARNAVEFVLVEELPARTSSLETSLLLALVKFDRFEWALEKATELGVTQIVPLAAARSGNTLLAAAAKRARRWEKILHASAQQARRMRPPSLGAAAIPEAAFREAALANPLRILLSERHDAPPLRDLIESTGAVPAVALALGPEGGWTDAELAAAHKAGFAEASLGPYILRTETAVTAALAIVNYALGSGRARDLG